MAHGYESSYPKSEGERLVELEQAFKTYKEKHWESVYELREMIDLLADKLGVEIETSPTLKPKESTNE